MGAAQQMEMPLVLHFVSQLGNPICRILTAAEMKKQTISLQAGLISVRSRPQRNCRYRASFG